MNRKFLFILVLLSASFVLGSCVKGYEDTPGAGGNCTPNTTGVPTSAEIASLQAYLTAHSISAAYDSRGFFYVIVAPGTGATPTTSSTVTVKYSGALESGAVFDQTPSPVTFLLSDLIKGWQYGLPLIKKGGTINLYLPPTLGYGCSAVGIVGPGSNLIFNIDLLDVQ